MGDFSFLKNSLTKRWVISAPRRARRPDVSQGKLPACPFCHNNEKAVYEIPNPSPHASTEADWLVKVVNNKFPFANIHEIVIHSPSHAKNFEKLPISQTELIFQTYRQRYNEHARHGQVYIFHNRGKKAGESLPHPHTQIAVIPDEVYLDIPPLKSVIKEIHQAKNDSLETDHFVLFCPKTSQWPDEVWIVPKKEDTEFGQITGDELSDLSHIIFSLTTIFDLRYEHDFPFNFYISPGNHWYLRLIPRRKTLGGIEIGTGVMVNTQKPEETMEFIKTHFHSPDIEKILSEHVADYHEKV